MHGILHPLIQVSQLKTVFRSCLLSPRSLEAGEVWTFKTPLSCWGLRVDLKVCHEEFRVQGHHCAHKPKTPKSLSASNKTTPKPPKSLNPAEAAFSVLLREALGQLIPRLGFRVSGYILPI